MQKTINKTKVIKEAALVYQNDPSLSYRNAAIIYGVSAQSVIRYYNSEIIPAPDMFISS